MVTKQLIGDSISTQYHNIITLFVILLAILQIMKKYEMICKKRNYHNPLEKDLVEFLSDDTVDVNTECIDCGCALQILPDSSDSKIYWVKEI